MVAPHYTPPELAAILAKYVPNDARLILEPSVGEGELIASLKNSQIQNRRFVCIDKSAQALEKVKVRLAPRLGRRLVTIQANFLNWRFQRCGFTEGTFDCVLMNPPFLARREDWSYANATDLLHLGLTRRVAAPTEVQFLLRAIRLLRQGGTLIAIVPGSVIAARSTCWLREALLVHGHIRVVRQLARGIFPGTECKCYVLVFRKAKGRVVRLLNHDLNNPTEVKVRVGDLDIEKNLDFSRMVAELERNKLVLNTKNLGWKPVGEVATITRGHAKTPFVRRRAIHTTNLTDGLWRPRKSEIYFRAHKKCDGLNNDDLLIKRVGRGSAASVGPCAGVAGLQFSDCVFRIRPNQLISRSELLLGFRSMVTAGWAAPILERGTGVSYIVERDILNFLIPTKFKSLFSKSLKLYEIALNANDHLSVARIEKNTLRSIKKLMGK